MNPVVTIILVPFVHYHKPIDCSAQENLSISAVQNFFFLLLLPTTVTEPGTLPTDTTLNIRDLLQATKPPTTHYPPAQ